MNTEKDVICPQIAHRRGTAPAAFFCEKQTAAHLNMSVQWLRKCRATGEGPAWMKFGDAIRYPIGELEAYVSNATRRFTGEHSNQDERPNSKK